MEQFSISFTLGKASEPHGANLAHNNRDFSAANIAQERTKYNLTFVNESLVDSYRKLFQDALNEYNAKQKACRRIDDYFDHILNGKREEAFYEVVVQFGDCKTASCGSPRGEIAKQMLIEYMQEFRERNPNLFVFNSVLHLDEASPHLHIDFIPFYTKGRQRGLSKGVSMRAALEEMGFASHGRFQTPVIGWEEAERIAMERILMQHGYCREEKNAHYEHMTVDEYKRKQDAKKMTEVLQQMQLPESNDVSVLHDLQMQIASLSSRTKEMEREKLSPYRAFYYSDKDKQTYVQIEMEHRSIPFRQTENGFEAQACYVDQIREIEKGYKRKPSSARDLLRNDIDRLLVRAKTVKELYALLEQENYEIKLGKYPAFRSPRGLNFIRLRSLGAEYSEFALMNRIRANIEFEKTLSEKIQALKSQSDAEYPPLRIMQFYIVAVKRGQLRLHKKNPERILTWRNDVELDNLLQILDRVNEGATLGTLRASCEKKDAAVTELRAKQEEAAHNLRLALDLREVLEMRFAGKISARFSHQQAEDMLRKLPYITSENWKNVEQMVDASTAAMKKADAELAAAEQELHKEAEILSGAERIYAGTYVQDLVKQERESHSADILPNGWYPADNNTSAYKPLKR